MRLLKSLRIFAAAAAVGASVSVAWASGLSASQPLSPAEQEQELPDLGSPATAAVSLEEEYQVGQAWAGKCARKAWCSKIRK